MSPIPDAFPRLRSEIDAAPANRDGETYYILYDRSGIAAARLLVSPLGLLVAGRLDGSASVLDVADALNRELRDGEITCSDVEQIIGALDEALFLVGDRFQDYQAQAARDFHASPVRQPCSAGSAYDDDHAALAASLDRMLAEAPPVEESGGAPDAFPRGVVSPHIDFLRGAPGYGQLYRHLAARPAPRTVVIIGTAHTPLAARFSLCEKDFVTPLGPLPLDRDLAARIRRAVEPGPDPDGDLLAHRGEHSIELQAVWLRHVYGENIRIVPILAASLGDFIEGGLPPETAVRDPALAGLASCLGKAVADGGVMVMASADLSHVGPRFGDGEEVTNPFLEAVEVVDREYLAALSQGATAGLSSLAQHGDRHHVCGSACIHALGLAIPDAKPRLLGYHQAASPEMRQAVTYAAMVFA